MTLDGDYATPAIVCSARNGICFSEGKCGSCDFAKRYESNKKLFERIEACPYKTETGYCRCEFTQCLGADCLRMM